MPTPAHQHAAQVVAQLLADEAGVKTVAREADSFLVELSQNVVSLWESDGTRGTLSRWFRSALPRWAQDIYIEGLSDGGIDGATAADLDDADLSEIDAWIASQSAFVPDFIDAAVDAGKGTVDEKNAKQTAVIRRMDYWRSSVADLGQRAKGKALDNPLCYWRLGNTEQHCPECLRLASSQPHRLSWYTERGYLAGTAGSNTTCGGYNCDCEIRTKKGDKLMYPV